MPVAIRDGYQIRDSAEKSWAALRTILKQRVGLRTMADPCSELLRALQRQSAGEDSVIDEIFRMTDLMCGERAYRDPVLTSQQARGIELLLNEWRDMFSFYPGRTEGLAPVTSLLSLICGDPQMEQLEIYGTKEWKEIVGLRGPVETVRIHKCGKCQARYPQMITGEFSDIIDLLCYSCGGVHFVSAYDAPKEVVCPCGGKAKSDCPSCGSMVGSTVEEMSPYQYFASHPLYRHDV